MQTREEKVEGGRGMATERPDLIEEGTNLCGRRLEEPPKAFRKICTWRLPVTLVAGGSPSF